MRVGDDQIGCCADFGMEAHLWRHQRASVIFDDVVRGPMFEPANALERVGDIPSSGSGKRCGRIFNLQRHDNFLIRESESNSHRQFE
jgi:hypothetical protein